MPRSFFTRSFLLIFAGPIVWIVHFGFIYGLNGVLCARLAPDFEWFGMHPSAWGILVASLIAIAVLVAILLWADSPDSAQDSRAFTRWMSVTLGVLSIIAIVWETFPVFLLPPCR